MFRSTRRFTPNKWNDRALSVPRNQRGMALLETLVATAIVGVAFVATLMGFFDSSTSAAEQEVDPTAIRLARSQMEYVYSLDYLPPPATYPSVDAPDAYAITADAIPVEGADLNIEKIVVTVSRSDGVDLVVEMLKTNR
ncbi:MAG: type II secretion system protein [Chloroflexi bacterium]|nr:type II secretion system protein [Chloroflexota bacterium]